MSTAYAANAARGYLVATLTPAGAESPSRTVRANTPSIAFEMLDADAAPADALGSDLLRVELHTPAAEITRDTQGQPVVVEAALDLVVPGGCTPAPGDAGDSDADSDARGDVDAGPEEDAGAAPDGDVEAASEEDAAAMDG